LIAVGFLVVIAVVVGVFIAFGQFGSNQPVKVLLQTTMGDITIQLRDDKPITAGNFKNLVEQGRYDGTIFHRVIEGFMIQGGQIDESIPTIFDEIGDDNHNVKGTVAMAKTSQPNSATSQFFINVVDNSNRYPEFDTTYAVFGSVTEGIDVAEEISRVQRDANDKPLTDVVLIKAEILP
jgi:peptidylprolyl isomerase